jgi:hypothetical protein
MRLMSKADLWRVNNRRLDALTAEIRRDIGYCEQRQRKDLKPTEDRPARLRLVSTKGGKPRSEPVRTAEDQSEVQVRSIP